MGYALWDGASTHWQNWEQNQMTKTNLKSIKRKGDPRRHCRCPLSQLKKIKRTGREDYSTSLSLSTKLNAILHCYLGLCLSLTTPTSWFPMASPFMDALFQSPVHALLPVFTI